MAINFGPKIITDGLMICLDPMNNKSYPFFTLPVKKGLNLWLDAADSGTLTTIGVNNNVITVWRDKSDYSNHASGRGNPVTSGSINSNQTIHLSGTTSYFVNSTLSIANEQQSIFTVFKQTVSSTRHNNFLFNGGSGQNYRTFVGTSSNTGACFIGDGSTWTNGSGANSPNYNLQNQTTILSYVNSGTAGTPYYSGITQVGKTGAGIGYTGYYLGAFGSTPTIQGVDGQLGEILVYNRKLDTKEIQKVHTYLGQKWGVTNYDRALFDIGSTQATSATTSGSIYTYNSSGFFRFPGTGTDSSITTTNSNGVMSGSAGSICFFARPTGAKDTYVSLRAGDNSNRYYVGYVTSKFLSHRGNGSLDSINSNTIANNTWHGIGITWKVGTTGIHKIYQSGILINTGSFFNTSSNITSFAFGGGGTIETTFPGDIGYYATYNRELTSGEIMQNYLALKSRYGL